MIHPIPPRTSGSHAQFGEDQIIQHILSAIGSTSRFLVDLGAHTMQGSNSRWFVEDGWDSIRLDGQDDPKANDIREHWILRDNIADLLHQYRCPQRFGFLSIDLDGNDYHILQAILQAGYRPDLICAEINPKWNADEAMVIEYNPEHRFTNNDYYGMGYAAAVSLGAAYGYSPVYLQDGVNVYLVRSEMIAEPIDLTAYIAKLPKRDWGHGDGVWIDLNQTETI